MGRMDLITYSTALETTVDLLQSVVEAYERGSEPPDFRIIRQLVEDIRRYIDIPTHRQMAEDLQSLAHDIVILGDRHNRRSSNNDRHIASVVAGEIEPRSLIDVYRTAGGHLLSGRVHPLRVKASSTDMPFGTNDLDDICLIVGIASNVIHQATNARPTSRDQWTAQAIISEIESQRAALLGDTRNMMRQIGRSWQRLADLIIKINQDSDTKVIDRQNNLGRKLDIQDAVPKDPIQFFRFIYGFFVH